MYPTDVLSEKQLEFIASRLPHPQAWTERNAYTNLELLPRILKVLRSDYFDASTNWRGKSM